MSENQKHMTMKKKLCSILVATQLMGVGLAVAETNTNSPTKHLQSAIQVNTNQVVAVSTVSSPFKNSQKD